MIECNNNIEHEIWNALVWRHFYKICYHGAYKELSMSPWVIYKAMIYIYIYIYIYKGKAYKMTNGTCCKLSSWLRIFKILLWESLWKWHLRNDTHVNHTWTQG